MAKQHYFMDSSKGLMSKQGFQTDSSKHCVVKLITTQFFDMCRTDCRWVNVVECFSSIIVLDFHSASDSKQEVVRKHVTSSSLCHGS